MSQLRLSLGSSYYKKENIYKKGNLMRILIIEDEERIVSFVKRGLEEECYAVDSAHDGEDGLNWITNFTFDLIILDVMLPKIDGITLCKRTRKAGIQTPILMLTAKDSVDDKVRGLDAGADDYLVKPFAFKELLSRVRAITRRQKQKKATRLIVDDLEIDLITRRIFRSGKEIELTNKEFSLLEFFMLNPGRILSRTLIGEHIWNFDYYNQSNIIDVYIRQLRRKVDDPFSNKLIQTVRGSGYKLQGGSKE